MSGDFEEVLKKLIQEAAAHKTPQCLEVETLWHYIEDKLSLSEKAGVEKHLDSCLYCLNLLVELKSFLHGKTFPGRSTVPLAEFFETLAQSLKDALRPFTEIRLMSLKGALSFAVLLLIVRLFYFPFMTKETSNVALQRKSGLSVVAYNDKNKPVAQAAAFGLSSSHVAVPGDILGYGKNIAIQFPDGKKIPVESVALDNGENVALLKAKTNSIPAAKFVSMDSIPLNTEVNVDDGAPDRLLAVSRVRKPIEIRQRNRENIRGSKNKKRTISLFLQITYTTARMPKGVVKTTDGKIIGFATYVQKDEGIGMVIPASYAINFLKNAKFVSLDKVVVDNKQKEAQNEYFKGILARDTENLNEAESHFKKAVELNPDHEQAHMSLAEIYEQKGGKDIKFHALEIQEYKAVSRNNPKNEDVHYALAECYLYYKNNPELALKEYKEDLRLDNDDAGTHWELGIYYLLYNNKKGAQEEYENLLRIDKVTAGKFKKLMDGHNFKPEV